MTAATERRPSRPEQLARADARRAKILDLIRASLASRQYPPTISELARDTGVSNRQVRVDLDTLAAAGFIERDAGEARGIRLLNP